MKFAEMLKLFVEAVVHAFHLGRVTGRAECQKKLHFNFTVEVRDKQRKAMQQVKITDEQEVRYSLNPGTLKGRPVKVQSPEWSVVSGDCTVKAADDGLSAVITSPEVAGVSVIRVSADADLGDGVEEIVEDIEVTVVDPNASSLGLRADQPTAKPDAPTANV